jgi:acyl-CoA synthetase (AMP-forming)/AMP-acid ligase II
MSRQSGPRTLVDLLDHHAESRPEALYARYLFADRPPFEATFAQTRDRCCAFAELLRTHEVTTGDLVLVILDHHEDLMAAFLGAMWLGAVPAFLPYPTPRLDKRQYASSLQALVASSEPRAVVTSAVLQPSLEEVLAPATPGAGAAGPRIVTRESVVDGGGRSGPIAHEPASPALIQYSSGSTGLQKGALLSHRAILAEIEGVTGFFELTRSDTFLTWIPLYHDWGLVCVALHALAMGTSFTLLSPFDWVKDPVSSFAAVHRYHTSVYYQPNFAFNFMAQRVKDRSMAGIDLSSIRICCNGAEPCFAESHEMFVDRFARWGLRRDSLAIVYGMAEVTNSVFAAGHDDPILVDAIDREVLQREQRAEPVARGHARAQLVLGVGRPLHGTELRVVDEQRRELPERRVGEVAIRSKAGFDGYYRNPEATAASLDSAGWYYSGDLGYRVDRTLFITGRKSDLIILAGVNIYPQDVEAICAEHPQVVQGRVAALGIEDPKIGTQRLNVVFESRSDDPEVLDDISRFIREQVAQRLDVIVARVAHAPRRWLLKTSSGKIARIPNCRRLGELGVETGLREPESEAS